MSVAIITAIVAGCLVSIGVALWLILAKKKNGLYITSFQELQFPTN